MKVGTGCQTQNMSGFTSSTSSAQIGFKMSPHVQTLDLKAALTDFFFFFPPGGSTTKTFPLKVLRET